MGFGVLANYTYSDGNGKDGADLPYNSRHQASLSPFFESGPVAIRGTYTWRSKYFTGIDRGDQMYVRDSANLDVSATYNFTTNRSEEHTSELQSLMRISYAVFCLKTKKHKNHIYKQR